MCFRIFFFIKGTILNFTKHRTVFCRYNSLQHLIEDKSIKSEKKKSILKRL